MNSFAVIETGGKQYKVALGTKVKVEKLEASEGASISFDKVLLKSAGDAVEVGTPYISGVAVEAKVIKNGRHEKKLVFRYHSKTRYRKKKGHRQHFTEIEVVKI